MGVAPPPPPPPDPKPPDGALLDAAMPPLGPDVDTDESTQLSLAEVDLLRRELRGYAEDLRDSVQQVGDFGDRVSSVAKRSR